MYTLYFKLIFVLFISYTNLQEEQPIKTTWHLNLDAEGTGFESQGRRGKVATEGLYLVSTAAKRVWEELYVHKKPVS